jgi:hypothetical protein
MDLSHRMSPNIGHTMQKIEVKLFDAGILCEGVEVKCWIIGGVVAECAGDISGHLPGAGWAHPDKFQAMADDGKDGAAVKFILELGQRSDRGIVDPAAAHASDVIVISGVAVKALQAPAKLQGLDFLEFREHFQVPINGGQRDAGQQAAHPFVEFIGAGVRIGPAQLFENQLSLAGHPQVGGFG